MDEELVGDSSVSEYELMGEDGEGRPPSYSEQFEEIFPWYLSIGMTPRQFWDEDCQLARYYREAERHREDAFNRRAHLQGLYIYEALCDVSPIFNSFAEKGTKPHPYPEEPYELHFSGDTPEKKDEKSPEQIQMEKNRSKMEAFMIGFNRAFKEKNKTKEEMTDG